MEEEWNNKVERVMLMVLVLLVTGVLLFWIMYSTFWKGEEVNTETVCFHFYYEDQVFLYNKILNESQLFSKIKHMTEANRTIANGSFLLHETGCFNG